MVLSLLITKKDLETIPKSLNKMNTISHGVLLVELFFYWFVILLNHRSVRYWFLSYSCWSLRWFLGCWSLHWFLSYWSVYRSMRHCSRSLRRWLVCCYYCRLMISHYRVVSCICVTYAS